MNKIQALANEMKQFFSPQTVTNVYSICKQLEIVQLKMTHSVFRFVIGGV